MNVAKIEKLEEVLKLKPTQKILGCKITRLTAAGENYGSLMLRLQIEIDDGENLDLVAKLLPPSQMLKEVFNVQTTFRNELGYYNVIVPLLQEFQRENGVKNPENFSAKCYGGRISLNRKDNTVDDGAVLLLENLKILGFVTVERTVGFDLPTSLLILKNLAYFHAVTLALKLKKPEIFMNKIKPYLADYIFPNMDKLFENIIRVLKENKDCVRYEEILRTIMAKKSVKTLREPFATVTHNDYWVNNIMLKYINGKAVDVKMVDFQIMEYQSPCRDLLFFIFSSIQQRVLEEHLDELIDFYYLHFRNKLEELSCDVTLFSREIFDKELEMAAKESEYFHTVVMFSVIFADASKAKELSDLTIEDFEEEVEFNKVHKEKLWYTTLEFAKRGWLY